MREKIKCRMCGRAAIKNGHNRLGQQQYHCKYCGSKGVTELGAKVPVADYRLPSGNDLQSRIDMVVRMAKEREASGTAVSDFWTSGKVFRAHRVRCTRL